MKKKGTKKVTKTKKTSSKSGGKKLIVADMGSCFWVNNGPVLKDMKELSRALKSISSEQYAYHVNGDRNDFASWVNDVLKDSVCANALRATKNQSSAQKVVAKRIASHK